MEARKQGRAKPAARRDSGRELVSLLRRMWVIRAFEEKVSALYAAREIVGLLHLGIGQEAVAVGVCSELDTDDSVFGGHRSHGHAIAKGADVNRLMAELAGRATGYCRGKGGSMHVVAAESGFVTASGVVGGTVPLALGAAFAAREKGAGRVAVVFFGDGAGQSGPFHESLNIASLWQLPVIFVCENNGYAEFTPLSAHTRVERLARHAQTYGIPSATVDGNDILAVREAMDRAVNNARAGKGPTFVECLTYRLRGHYEGDPGKYRELSQLADWKKKDPIARFTRVLKRRRAASAGKTSRRRKPTRVRSWKKPPSSPFRLPGPSPRRPGPKCALEVDMPELSYLEAIRSGLLAEMRQDASVYIFGEDVALGGPFGVTQGIAEELGAHRVVNTPISEGTVMGVAIGAALSGLRPVVEIMFVDFITLAMDQLVNHAAKLHYMSGGQLKVPLTVRVQCGVQGNMGAHHSQSLESWFLHVPGLKVVMPSNPADAQSLMRAAIRDDNPVLFVEHRGLYFSRAEVPEGGTGLPMGKASVLRAGTDVTVAALSRMVVPALEAADALAGEGISVEVVDLRGLVPLDVETLVDSVKKTSRLIVVHEAVEQGGAGAEIAARVQEEALYYLDSPILRVAAPNAPVPCAPPLESQFVPDKERIVEAVRRALSTGPS